MREFLEGALIISVVSTLVVLTMTAWWELADRFGWPLLWLLTVVAAAFLSVLGAIASSLFDISRKDPSVSVSYDSGFPSLP